MAEKEMIITLVSKNKSYNIDIKEVIDTISIDKDNVLEIITRQTPGKSPKITKIIETILQVNEKETASLRIVKTK